MPMNAPDAKSLGYKFGAVGHKCGWRRPLFEIERGRRRAFHNALSRRHVTLWRIMSTTWSTRTLCKTTTGYMLTTPPRRRRGYCGDRTAGTKVNRPARYANHGTLASGADSRARSKLHGVRCRSAPAQKRLYKRRWLGVHFLLQAEWFTIRLVYRERHVRPDFSDCVRDALWRKRHALFDTHQAPIVR